MNPIYYIADGLGGWRTTNDIHEWGNWFGSPDIMRPFSEGGKVVAKTRLPDGVEVSTVFLGMDHGFGYGAGDPILFETMIFGGPQDQYQERYCTFQEAQQGHAEAVQLAQSQEPVKGYE